MSKRIKEPVKWQGVPLPITLIDMVREFVIERDEYRSMSEFIKEAVREKLRREKQ